MAVIIYALLLTVIFSLCVVIFYFLRFMASVLSLIGTINETARDNPWDHATGGFFSMWRVLRHENNAIARNRLLKNMAVFFGTFAFMMAAGLLLITLNTEHCILSMIETSSDETQTVICEAR